MTSCGVPSRRASPFSRRHFDFSALKRTNYVRNSAPRFQIVARNGRPGRWSGSAYGVNAVRGARRRVGPACNRSAAARAAAGASGVDAAALAPAGARAGYTSQPVPDSISGSAQVPSDPGCTRVGATTGGAASACRAAKA